MLSTNFLTFLLLTTTTACLFISQVYASPVTDLPKPSHHNDDTNESYEELDDLNAAVTSDTINNKLQNPIVSRESASSSSFRHRDEDQPGVETNLDQAQFLKYDVEILEAGDIQKENIEIEERFKGSAIEIDTDTFIDENIEVHGGDAIQQSHMILSIILVIVALISIVLYAALVIWRSHLEQRYGMRELLVTNDDYCQQQHNNSSDAESNTRHFMIGQL